jgi:hypothetical protein
MLWAFLDVSGFPSNLPASGSEQELRKARECLPSFATESYVSKGKEMVGEQLW